MKIAVCDKNQTEREAIESLIKIFFAEKNVTILLKSFVSGEEFLESGFLPDILLLEMETGAQNGLHVGKKIKALAPEVQIICVSCLHKYLFAAINHVHAFGYLTKPVEKRRLDFLLEDALHFYGLPKDGAGKVSFLTAEKARLELDTASIYYFEYTERAVKIVTAEKTYLCREKIGDIERKMQEYDFAMCHRSFVVNLHQIEKISEQSLLLKNGERIDLAQKRAAAIRKKWKELCWT